MAVLPESMDRLDVQDASGSLSIVENYIRYMGERIEFAMQNVTRNVSAAGVSSAELYVLIVSMNNTLSALQSTVNALEGRVTALSAGQVETRSAIEEIRAELSSVEERLDALETPNTEQAEE